MPAGNFVFNAGKKGYASEAAGANFERWDAAVPSANHEVMALLLCSGADALLDAADAEDALTVGDLGVLAFEHAVVTGYTAGGLLVDNRTTSTDTASNFVGLVADHIVIPQLAPGGTITDILVYHQNGSAVPADGVPIRRIDVSATALVGANTQFSIKWFPGTGTSGRVLKIA